MGENIFFILLYFLFPASFFASYRYFGIKYNEISVLNVAIFSMFVFSYIGFLPLYFYWDDYRYSSGVTDRTIIYQMYAASTWSIFSLLWTFGILNKISGGRSHRFRLDGLRKFSVKEVMVSQILFLICLVIFLIYISSVPEIAFLTALSGSSTETAIARSQMTNAFQGSYHWYRLFITDLSVFISYAFYANHLVAKKRSSWWVFCSSFLFCIIFLLASAQKGPIVWYFIGLYLVFKLVCSEGVIDVKSLFALAAKLLTCLIVLYILFMGVEEILLAVKLIFSRFVLGGMSASYFYFLYFPEVKGFLYGASFPNPGGFLPFEPYHLTTEIMEWRFPDEAKKGVVGSSPTVFWAEAYANFSWLGVFISPFLVGIVAFFYSSIVWWLENTPFKAALIVWLALYFKNIAATGFSSFLINVTLMAFIAIVGCLVVVSKKVTRK